MRRETYDCDVCGREADKADRLTFGRQVISLCYVCGQVALRSAYDGLDAMSRARLLSHLASLAKINGRSIGVPSNAP